MIGFLNIIRHPAFIKNEKQAGCLTFNKKRRALKTQCFQGFGDPAGIRTPDTLLKRQVLCLLSYWIILNLAGMAGIEPANAGVKVPCLTPWLHPIIKHGRSEFCSDPLASKKWGGIWGSNPRHPEPQSGALPTELIPPYDAVCLGWHARRDSNPRPTA